MAWAVDSALTKTSDVGIFGSTVNFGDFNNETETTRSMSTVVLLGGIVVIALLLFRRKSN